jgi:hypothetical protein
VSKQQIDDALSRRHPLLRIDARVDLLRFLRAPTCDRPPNEIVDSSLSQHVLKRPADIEALFFAAARACFGDAGKMRPDSRPGC